MDYLKCSLSAGVVVLFLLASSNGETDSWALHSSYPVIDILSGRGNKNLLPVISVTDNFRHSLGKRAVDIDITRGSSSDVVERPDSLKSKMKQASSMMKPMTGGASGRSFFISGLMNQQRNLRMNQQRANQNVLDQQRMNQLIQNQQRNQNLLAHQQNNQMRLNVINNNLNSINNQMTAINNNNNQMMFDQQRMNQLIQNQQRNQHLLANQQNNQQRNNQIMLDQQRMNQLIQNQQRNQQLIANIQNNRIRLYGVNNNLNPVNNQMTAINNNKFNTVTNQLNPFPIG